MGRLVTGPAQSGRRNLTRAAGLLAQLRSWARRWAVPSLVLNLILILIFISIAAFVPTWPGKTPELSPAGPACPVAACPDGWIEYWGKCYYFSEAEANWTDSQKNCSALSASLAGIDSQQEMDFLMRYKGPSDYWIGLQRDLGQPWRWANGSEFNKWFPVEGRKQCAFLGLGKVASSQCWRIGPWICRKPAEKTKGRAK